MTQSLLTESPYIELPLTDATITFDYIDGMTECFIRNTFFLNQQQYRSKKTHFLISKIVLILIWPKTTD